MKATSCSGNCNQGRLLCNCHTQIEIDNTSIIIAVVVTLVAFVASVIAIT